MFIFSSSYLSHKPILARARDLALNPQPQRHSMTRFLFLITLLSVVSLNFSCKKKAPSEPELPQAKPTPPSLELSVDGVSCTEAWIKVKKLNDTTFLPIIVSFKSRILFTGYLAQGDTVLYVDSLIPNTTYTAQAKITNDTAQNWKEFKITTLATTSHNFTWQTYEFGDYNPSALMDVTIIDENNIWAVGKIYLNDSLGHSDPNNYNAVHWDGQKWESIKIAGYGGWACRTVLAFSKNNIWFEGTIKWDGKNYTVHNNGFPLLPNGDGWMINKMWGTSSNDLYALGNGGNIAYFNGKSWQKMESGTDFSLTDIFGSSNGNIYSAGSKFSEVKGIILRKNQSGQFETMVEGDMVSKEELFHPKLYGSLSSVWVDENNVIYTAGNIMYQFKNNRWDYVKSLPENYIGGNPGTYYRGYIGSVRGNASNDIIIAGDRNTLKHFNGIDWQQLGLPYSASSDISWGSIAIKGNIVVAVGNQGYKAKILMLKR